MTKMEKILITIEAFIICFIQLLKLEIAVRTDQKRVDFLFVMFLFHIIYQLQQQQQQWTHQQQTKWKFISNEIQQQNQIKYQTINFFMLIINKIKQRSFAYFVKYYNGSNFLRKRTYSSNNSNLKQFIENLQKYNFDHLSIQQPYKNVIQLAYPHKITEKSQFLQIYDIYTQLNHKQIFKSNNINQSSFYSKLCDHAIKHNILDIQFRRIAKMPQLTQINQRIIHKFLLDLCHCIFGKFNHHRDINKPLNNQQSYNVINVLKRLKPILYLVDDHEIQIFQNILKTYRFFHSYNVHQLNIFNSQRNAISIILEKIINCPNKMPKQNFIDFVTFCARFGVYNISSSMQRNVWLYIFKKFPKDEQNNLQESQILLYSLGKQYYINSQVNIYFKNTLSNISNLPNASIKYIIKILQGSLKLRILNKQNYFNNYSKISRHILKEKMMSQQLIMLIYQLLTAQIWDVSVWQHFFKSYDNFTKSNLRIDSKLKSIIFSLELFKDQIPPQIYSIYQKILVKNHKLKKIKQMPMTKIKSQQSKHLNEQKNYYQINIKKILDSAKIEYICEHQIQIFVVDFYLPKYKLIIEVHGPNHYIINIDTQQYIDNSQTIFKKKVLDKLGYNYYEINILNEVIPAQAAKKIFTKYQIVS